jgi:GTP-dependent dephospho-CoA kinase
MNPHDTDLLKHPFGTLIADRDITEHRLAFLLNGSKKVISVGDATTERLTSFNILPDVAVIDGKERRSKRNYPSKYAAKELYCTNPPGTISKDAVMILKDAISLQPPVRVFVDGEEDMLALPIFFMAPLGSSVLYGQPLEGLVLVKITVEKQKEAKELMYRICRNSIQ